jgi:ActR/RegA family two-component response regulator
MKDIIILIIDDDKNICDYLKRLLESLNCRIEVAYKLSDGLALMRELTPTPSFVFLDLHFTKENLRAEATINCIEKFHEINPQASIIVITGLLDEKIKQMANALGAAFLQKPDLRSQEDAWRSIEEAIRLGEQSGQQPYEITSRMIQRITELRQMSNEELVSLSPNSFNKLVNRMHPKT